MSKRHLLPALLLLAGCASQSTAPQPAAEPAPAAATAPAEAPKPVEAPKSPAMRKAESELSKGLAAYENGDYKVAAQALQQALDQGLPNKIDQARAYKHLAFIACASRQVEPCKEHFRKALAAYPKLGLSKTEAGHPVWGPAFQQVKAESRKKAPPSGK